MGADMISVEDELSLEDEALALAHVDMDIKDFEGLKKTIAYLEDHIRKHADVNVVESKELVEADKMLKDLDAKIIKPYEQELLSLKSQIEKLNHKFDNESIVQINAMVENAEMFLQTSNERLEQMEQLEQEWEVAEEGALIQEMIDLDERREFSGKTIIIEALKPTVSGDLKEKLGGNVQDDKPSQAYPTSMSGGRPKLDLDKSLTEAKSMFKKMKQMKMLKNVEKQTGRPTNFNSDKLYKSSNDGNYKRNMELQKIAEMAKIAALRQVKENLEREVFSDLKGKDMFADPVEHYSTGVKEALETAKKNSHEFIHEKLHHEAHLEEDELDASLNTYWHVFLAVVALVVLQVVLLAFRAFTRRKRSRIVLQNLSGVGGCDKSYMELESVKEDDGWGRSWSPWSAYKKNQHKFK